MPSSDEATDGTSTREDQLERLRKLRGGQRGATTKLIQTAKETIRQNIGKTNVDVLARTNAMCIQLKEKRRTIEQLDNQILEKCPATDIDREIEEATEVSTFSFHFILNSLYTITLQQINTKKEIKYISYIKII